MSGEQGAGPPDPEAARERYEKVFRHSNDAIMVVDIESESFVDVNPAACEMLGYEKAQFLAMDPGEIHPEDMDRVREEFIGQVVEEGAGFTDDLTCVTRNGREIPTEVSGAALDPGGEGDPSRMVAMLRNVSDRVRRERELEAQVERLDRFADIVSHDIRNPLDVIQSRAALAEETGDAEHFEALRDAVDRIDGMLEQLLRLSRAGNVIGERSRVDLEGVCREAWRSVEAREAELTVRATGGVYADGGRLRDLLANLFDNAVSHAGPSVSVVVGEVDGSRRGFYVADDGPGIPPQEREQVLEWGHTTDPEGTGLGLAVVAQVAQAHGWTVAVTDSDPGGARFEFVGVEPGPPGA